MKLSVRKKQFPKEGIAYARVKSVKGSIQKVNLVAALIRGLGIDDAELQLKFSKKRAACDLLKVLNAAVSNAENNFGFDIDTLFVSEVLVGKAVTVKRMRAAARGRSARILKPYVNITIFVKERAAG